MKTHHNNIPLARLCIPLLLPLFIVAQRGEARPQIRQAFFAVFPSATGTRLDTLPSNAGHCGVCHYDFDGGGPRNPWGSTIEGVIGGYPNTDAGRSNAVYSVRNAEADGDGYTTSFEVTNRTYSNTPTFPGLTAANVGSVSHVTLSEIQPYLVPASGVDTTPPIVTVTKPNGGELVTANRLTNITWTATDPSGIAGINIYLSLDNGATYQPLALTISNSGTFAWAPANRPTSNALVRVIATDNAGNTNSDRSDAVFRIASPVGGRVPSTLRDFDLPGTQPLEGGADIAAPSSCASCHGNYAADVEPYANWRGSMMAMASRDLLFRANMAIANQDAPDSGDLCLRCHFPRGWLGGRSVPTDGSRMQTNDAAGVSCDLCHRMVDPVFSASSATNDSNIIAALTLRGTNYGNGMMVIDPTGTARGPFTNTAAPHSFISSSFHRKAAFCGTCHDVSNPAFQKDSFGNYVVNPFDSSATNTSPHSMLPVERTFSEWSASAYNSTNGVYAPQFAGNKADGRVSTCQDCHMRDVSGRGCNPTNNPTVTVRSDLPLHDMTGGSTWMPAMLTNLYPAETDAAAVQSGIARAQQMLANAASVAVAEQAGNIKITVTNETGHKLPTGYPEGRRIWVNVKFYDVSSNLLGEVGAYDTNSGHLSESDTKVYEVKPGIETNLAQALGLPPGPSFHFVLNNRVFSDNRIPPRGFAVSNFAAFGGVPVGHAYADGQYWDDTLFTLPPQTARAEVRLYYQSTSKEFIEFLRDENFTDPIGQQLYSLWDTNGKCPPTLMAHRTWTPAFCLMGAQKGNDGAVQIRFMSRPGATYTIEYADALGASPTWRPFTQQGTLTATNSISQFRDDFTAATSGSAPPSGTRFYRFRHNATP